MKTLILPKNQEILCTQSVVIIGTNGSGKTRLGAWIDCDSPQREKVHRISAQKSLSFPESTSLQSLEHTEMDLIGGHHNYGSHKGYTKPSFRWKSNPATHPLNDYNKLLQYLFSETATVDSGYRAASKKSPSKIEPPVTNMDKVKDLWESILPHRTLEIGDLAVKTVIPGTNTKNYKASEMSDGERVIFYLIGQCLAAPTNGIIVIDEPELHLHKSIQSPLWQGVETLRPDCLFVYLTHDIDFASEQREATKVWIQSYDGTDWDWQIVKPDSQLPDQLLLQILGNRKAVLFVEGEKHSQDVCLYRELFPHFLVMPRGGCQQVITTVKAFRSHPHCHHLKVFGLIDRDRRGESEIGELEKQGIYVLGVAEVENLFCTEEILRIISTVMGNSPEEDFKKVSDQLFSWLEAELTEQLSLQVCSEISSRLHPFGKHPRGVEAIEKSLQEWVSKMDVSALYAGKEQAFKAVLKNRDYKKLLALYNRKNLSSRISKYMGLADKSLPERVLCFARGVHKESIKKALEPYWGNFQPDLAMAEKDG